MSVPANFPEPAARTDAELIVEIKQNSKEAFTVLYRRYHALLYMYAYKLVGDEQTGKDLVQEIFISLWNKRERLDLSVSIRPYLYTAVRYKFFKLLNHNKIREDYRQAFEHMAVCTAANSFTDERLLIKELVKKVEMLAAKLPGKMGTAFMMSRIEHYSNEEIANILSVSEKTVQNLLSAANKILSPKIKQQFYHYLFLF